MSKYIEITQGQKTLVDDEDYDYLNQWRWNASWSNNTKSFRVRRFTISGTIYLHRVIMNAPKDFQVDHINHDTLDNRKENLRLVTNSQNMINRRVQSNNTSGVKGVYKNGNKFVAQIWIDGKSQYLGIYKNFKDAEIARRDAEIKIHGQYAQK